MTAEIKPGKIRKIPRHMLTKEHLYQVMEEFDIYVDSATYFPPEATGAKIGERFLFVLKGYGCRKK